MSEPRKRTFASFLRTPPETISAPSREAAAPDIAAPAPVAPGAAVPIEEGGTAGAVPSPSPLPTAMPIPAPDRLRHLTSTGRVRTHTANRQLPGVTLRLSEARWERLKMLSLQERRPIQEILGEAMEVYMKSRGLPW